MLCLHCRSRYGSANLGYACNICHHLHGRPLLRLPRKSSSERGIAYDDEPVPPEFATTAWPGSAEKVDVIAHRARRGAELWHQADADPID